MQTTSIHVLRTLLLAGLLVSLDAVVVADGVDVPTLEDPLAVDEDRADAAVARALVLANAVEQESKQDEGVDANVLVLERRLLPYIERIFKAERSFIPRVCVVTDQQRQDLAKATDGIPRRAARKCATAQIALRGKKDVQARGPNLTTFDQRTLILNELQRAVRDCLEPAQAERYAAELAKRAAHRKRAAAMYLVAELDERLTLSGQQRVHLTKSLFDNWQDGWGQPNRMRQHHPLYFPQIPDRLVVPFLTPRQRVVWHGTQKQDVPSGGGMGLGNAFVILDDFDIDVRQEKGVNKK